MNQLREAARRACVITALSALLCCPVQAPPVALAAADPCSEWQQFVCKHVSDEDSLCGAVQRSVGLFTAETCAAAVANEAYTERQLDKRAAQCGVLADKICADLPGMTRFCKLARDKLARYTPDFCVDMLRDYPKTLELLRKQATADRLAPERAAMLLAGEPPAFGPKDAPLQVVEFIDYESPYSPQTAQIVRHLAQKYAGRLHFVIRQFPLPDNPHAHLAAQAALAAEAQGKYWPMHDALLEHREQLDRAALLRYAKQVGLDVPAFRAALDHKRYAAAVDADLALGTSLKVVGMPTVYVNGERMLNSVDEAGIVDALEGYLAAAPASAAHVATHPSE